MRALIIENSRLYRELLDNILMQLGCKNDIGDSISSARKFLDSETYDIICVNQFLKDGSGIDFAKLCKNHELNAGTPILFLTSEKNFDNKDIRALAAEVIQKQNLQQITDQITRFTESLLDPVFTEGRILFVEDEKTTAMIILKHLTKKAYRVSHFTSAEEAWDEFNKVAAYGSDTDAYDLVITDITLEGKMDGRQLVAKIRELNDARGFIPIIAITGTSSNELRLSLYQEGINDFLNKPLMPEEMLVRIKNLITNKRLLDKVHDNRRELHSLATTDKLTGCHNRHSLTEFAGKFVAQAQRHHYPVSLMVIDLDHFKAVNDTHGHATGDIVLEAIGKLLNKTFREGDLVARFGGEEFVVLLNHCDDIDAKVQAERLRATMEGLKPANLTVTPSIGLTTLTPGAAADFETLFAAADKGVYEAKENGRNQVVTVALE